MARALPDVEAARMRRVYAVACLGSAQSETYGFSANRRSLAAFKQGVPPVFLIQVYIERARETPRRADRTETLARAEFQ